MPERNASDSPLLTIACPLCLRDVEISSVWYWRMFDMMHAGLHVRLSLCPHVPEEMHLTTPRRKPTS
jgi:hypothetical protein